MAPWPTTRRAGPGTGALPAPGVRGRAAALAAIVLRSAAILLPTAVLLPAAAVAAAASTPLAPYQLRIELGAHAGPVRGIAISADQRYAVTVSDDKTARVWNLARGSDGRLRPGTLRQVLRPAVGDDAVGRLYGVAAHPQDDLVAVGGTTAAAAGGPHRILLFEIGSGRFAGAIDARADDVTRLQWTTDGRVLLAVYRGGAVRAFARNGTLLFEQRFSGPSYGLAVSADGLIAASSYDGHVYRFRYRDGAIAALGRIATPTPAPRGVALSPDGRRLAIGYRGDDGRLGAPTVHDAGSGALLAQLPRPPFAAGNLAAVAFGRDGDTLFAAGSGYRAPGRHPLLLYDLGRATVRAEAEAAANTITDGIVAADGTLLFSTFDGRWGTASPALQVETGAALLADMRRPDRLRISDDGRRVAVLTRLDAAPQWFDLDRRLVTDGPAPADLHPPRLAARDRRDTLWENVRAPRLAGRPIPLAADEIARTLVFDRSGALAMLGTSRRLLQLAADGRVAWARDVPAEVVAINLTADGATAVGALADGTIRWWRSADGTPLASLLMLADRRWIVWTPDGRYDAGVGADRLAGWAVNRDDTPLADFVSLNRFRERFHRPDRIDEVLGAGLPSPTARVLSSNDTPGPPNRLPPIVDADGAATVDAGSGAVRLPFRLRAGADPQVEVRIDGRPAPDARITLDAASPAGVALVEPPAGASTVQILASDAGGVSEPLGVRLASPAAPTSPASPVTLEPLPAEPEAPAAGPTVGSTTGTTTGPATSPATGSTLDSAIDSPARAVPAAAPARLFALAVGVGAYRDPAYRLGLPAKDARDFVAALTTQQGRLYPKVTTRLLTDADATQDRIREAFDWLRTEVGPADVAIVFLAGHGIDTGDAGYYFLPWDGDANALAGTAVPETTIRGALARIRGKVLFFVDTCYAGGAVGTFRSANRNLGRLANDLASSENGVIVFASSTGRQLSEENDAWGNGAFTRAVIDGLNGQADFRNSGVVTYKALDFYVSERVHDLTEGRQTPVTISPIGVPDFAVARSGI
ncbi:MAG: caspase family protein [Lautropia sp.]